MRAGLSGTPKAVAVVSGRMQSDSCDSAWCGGADWCDVAAAADVLSGKWHPVVVAVLLDNPRGFTALEDVADDLSSTVLSSTLQRLEADGIVDRRVVSERPHRVEYALTDRGRALEPVLDAMQDWGDEYGPSPSEC